MTKKRVLVLSMLCSFGLIFWGYLQQANDFQITGQMNFVSLDHDVEVRRDDYGMAYILAKTDDDLWRAQGFVTAQQMCSSVSCVSHLPPAFTWPTTFDSTSVMNSSGS